MRILTAAIISIALFFGLTACDSKDVNPPNSPPVDLEEAAISEFEYEYNADLQGVEITKYTGLSVRVRIPETVERIPVTGIGHSTFEDNNSITYVYIPNSVTSIDVRAFMNCSNLTNIIIPESVTSIGQGAFCGVTGLISITIPGSVTNFEDNVFQDCKNLTSVTILDGVTRIGVGMFSGCTNLASVTIPNSVTSIGASAFSNCTALTNIKIPSSVTNIGAWSDWSTRGLYAVRDTGAFEGCTELKSVTYKGKKYSVQQNIDHIWNGLICHRSFTETVSNFV